MAESAAQIQYRQEQIAEFEERMSWLRQTTVQEAVIKGNQATFLVAGSNGETADTRGINGLIPAHALNLTQSTATLTEWQYLKRVTSFNMFQSQGNLTAQMQADVRAVLNRRIDADIVAQLDTATTNIGSGTMTLAVVAKALTTLGENEVSTDDEDNMWAVATPAVRGYLMQVNEFNSSDWVDMKYLNGKSKRVLRWAGFNWIFHPNLTGVGTAAEKIYFYHRDAIGSAFDMANVDVKSGYDDEQDYSWARSRSYTGAKLLQQTGIVQFTHDASAI